MTAEVENAVLLRRLDAWQEGDNAGPLIRWAATYLRGELADGQETFERLMLLLLSLPGWSDNYTATLNGAKWVLEEAWRVGWVVSIGPSDAVVPA